MLTALVVSMLAASPGLDQTRPQTSAPAFRLLRAGGGVTQILPAPLDQLFASEMTGNWFSLRGDGTTAGPLALSAVGSPTAQSDRVCPNGPDCGAVTSRRIASGSYFKTSAISFAPSAFSVCAFVNADNPATGSNLRIVAKDDSATKRTFHLGVTGAGAWALSVYASGGTASINSGSPAAGAWHFVCGTHSSGSTKLYVDGAQSGSTSTVATGTLNDYSDTVIAVGAESGGLFAFPGRIGAAFVTQKELSASTIAAMATAVLPSVQGSRGEAIATTRSTVRTCCNSAGCALLPANRPCVQGAALDVAGTRTNVLTRFSEIDLAPWGSGGTPVVTADSVIALDGTKTADTILDDDGAVAEYRTQSVSVTAGAAYTFSCYAQAGTSSTATLLLDSTSCPGLSVGANWSRISCTDPSTSAASVPVRIYPTNSSTPAATGSVAFKDCQVEPGSVATPVCPTTTAAAVCNGDVVSVDTYGWPVASGSFSFDYTPGFSAAGSGAPGGAWLRALTGATTGYQFGLATSGNPQFARWEAGGGTVVQPASAPVWTAGQRYHLRVEWNPSTATIWRDEVQLVTGAFATVTAIGSTAYLGNNSTGTSVVTGAISNFCIGAPGACR